MTNATPEEIETSLDAALEAGYRHIDTAYLYRNEDSIGRVLKRWFDSGKLKRKDLFIVTKLPDRGNRAESVEKYIKISLTALQLDYVDLYLIHTPVGRKDTDPNKGAPGHFPELDMTTDHISLWKAMEAQVDAGRAKAIGLSNFNACQIKRVWSAARIKPANLQVELHVYFQQRELTAFCKALDITVCAYAPIGNPSLSFYKPLEDPVVGKIAKKHNKTPAQVLLRWIMQRGIVVIPKSKTPSRIKENFEVRTEQLPLKYPEMSTRFRSDTTSIESTIDAALKVGYRHFDTAYFYRNEAEMGKAFKKWLDSGKLKREELFIVTKLPSTGNRASSVEKYIKLSLEALQLDYVDLYLIHSPVGHKEKESSPGNQSNWEVDMDTDLISLWKAMELQVDAGRARSIGVSNFNANQVKRIVQAARIIPSNNQVELHLYYQQKELAAFCKALDVTICAYAPLGSPAFPDFYDPVVLKIAKNHNKTPAQILLRQIVQRGIVVIPKSSKPGRIRENFQIFDFKLTEDEMYELSLLDRGKKGSTISNVAIDR
uniref:(California timema) hypothetical protein n=1 Tax=Timema californicum TaxID=61474 RepID=A0A7R9P3P4_TIMCA|nr:unnamed protein product [Timema californicum]